MAKIKVRDLAKKLKKPINDVIVALKRQGIYVESQSSMLSGSAAAKVEQYFNQQPNKQENNTRQPAKQPAKKKPVRHTGGLDSNGNYSSFIGSEEEEMLQKVNALGIGPQGFGGKTTALAVNIEQYPAHIASLPVAVNINCHVTRHKTEVI